MYETTASSPTESGCAGVSRPVTRKGIMLFTVCLLGLVKGTEVEIRDERGDYYEVRTISEPWIDKYVPKELVMEVSTDV